MKALKIIGGIIGAVILVGIVALILLATFVSPNRFKPVITDQVKKFTGRTLTIDGDLSWTVFPSLGVKVGHLELSNPPAFKQKNFAEIESATVSVKFLPLLHSKVESSGITLKGLKLYLVKNPDGTTNWQDLQNASPQPTAKEQAVASKETAKRSALGLVISGIDISDAVISWDNQQAKQTIDIKNFELHARDINLTSSFPFETSFNFTGKNPNVSGNVSMTSKIALSLDQQMYSIDNMDLNAKIKQDQKKFDINIKGNVAADLNKDKLQLGNFVAQIANLKLTGKMNIADLLTKPTSTGHLQIQPFDVKKWLEETGQDASSVQSLKNLSGDFDFTAGTSLQSVDLKGNLQIDEVRASKLLVTNIIVQTKLQKGVLNLAPISAAFYQGTVQGDAKVNLNTAAPQISLNAKMANVQAKPLLTDLNANEKLKINGAGNVDLNITTSGTSGDTIVKNLNGTAKLAFNNGVLEGIDIGYLLDSAHAFASKQASTATNSEKTEFGTLTGTVVIHNGVITMDDLYLNAPRFETKGNGTINLVSQQITYRLKTTAKKTTADEKNSIQNLYGLPVPILISGDMSSPHIQLDTEELMKAIAQQQIEKVKSDVKDKILDQIKGQGNAGAIINGIFGGH